MSNAQEISYGVLGPLDVRREGFPVEITRGRPRSLLAALLLSTDETVSTTRLVDSIWGPSPPASADQLIQVYVSQLRRTLGEESIITRPSGYGIAAGTSRIDAAAFQRLALEAAQVRELGRREDALAAYDEALALWRGPVLAGTPVAADAAARAAQLEELRWSAIEERSDLQLELGHHHELVPELERLVSEQPFRERLIAQLMLALYRSGRQADALQIFQDAHRRFVDELGLTPNPALQELQQAILRQDRQLDAPGPASPRDVPHKTRRKVVTVAIAVAALAAIAAAGLAMTSKTRSRTPTVQTDSIVALDAATGAVRHVAPSHGAPAAVTAGGGRLWVVNTGRRTLDAFAAGTLDSVSTIGLRGIPHEILYDGHAIWITNGFDGTLSRVTPGEIASPPFRPEPKSAGRLTLAFGAGSLWVGSRDNVITRLTPLGRELALIHGIRTPQALAVGFHSVWVAQATSVDLLRIDARTNRIVKSIPLGGIPSAVAVTRNALWALAPTEGQLWRIDPHTDAVTATIDVGPDTSALVAAGNGIWVAAGSLGTLIRIDPGTNKATATIELHHPIAGIASTGDQLLVTIQ